MQPAADIFRLNKTNKLIAKNSFLKNRLQKKMHI